jgi:hypothetical protein
VSTKLGEVTFIFVMSVRPSSPAWNNSAPTGRILVKFDVWIFYENLSTKFKFRSNLTRLKGILREDLYTRMGPKVSGLTYKSRAKWKILWGIYSAIYGEFNVSVSVCVEIKGDYIKKNTELWLNHSYVWLVNVVILRRKMSQVEQWAAWWKLVAIIQTVYFFFGIT